MISGFASMFSYMNYESIRSTIEASFGAYFRFFLQIVDFFEDFT